MNIVGIVTEHNPFHNGHLYHVQQARRECDAEIVISVMSGHFLQRGEPALFNKWARAKAAIVGGADMVVELPTAFSVRSASAFAAGSVAVLNAMGVVTHLCFGSEAGSIDNLWPAARLMANETGEFKILLNKYLDTGMPFPAARSRAIVDCLRTEDTGPLPDEAYASPNNILGIEYLKALLKQDSCIKPTAIKRVTAGYHDRDITSTIASATSIRDELKQTGVLTAKIKNVVPPTTLAVMAEEAANRGPVFLDNYTKILFYLLRIVSPEYLASLVDVSEGLEHRILAAADKARTASSLVAAVKTKRYTWTRIQRILSYVMLGYTQEMARDFDATGPRYIRVLGLSANGRRLLKIIKKRADIPVLTRTVPYLNDANVAPMLKLDIKATDIYTLLYPGNEATAPGLDWRMMPFAEK